jgi:hypothetical protein
MCARRSPVARPSPASRSKVSNGSALHQNVDERSSGARRFRDLVAAFSSDLGDLSEADLALVRTAAALTLKSEQMQAQLAAGEIVDSDALIRLAGTTRRSLASIQARAKPKANETLQEYLSRKAAAGDLSDDTEED